MNENQEQIDVLIEENKFYGKHGIIPDKRGKEFSFLDDK